MSHVRELLKSTYKKGDRLRRHLKVNSRATYLRLHKKKGVKVNLGGGQTFNPDWMNLDFNPDVRGYEKAFIDVSHDLCSSTPLPFKDNSVDAFYTSHTMEHLPEIHLEYILRECLRTLKPGCGIRIVVPDFEKALIAFHNNDTEWFDHWQSKSRKNYRTDPSIAAKSGREKLLYQLVYYFCGHCINEPGLLEHYDRISDDYEFADFVISLMPQAAGGAMGNFGYHANWLTTKKLSSLLIDTGFRRVVATNPYESIFSELRPKYSFPRTWLSPVGFDDSYPHISLTMDAVK